MARPPVRCTVLIDGAIYTAPKQIVSDYCLKRLSGFTHGEAIKGLSGTVCHPVFSLSVDSNPQEISNALRKLILSTPTDVEGEPETPKSKVDVESFQ